jgi:twinkle protein
VTLSLVTPLEDGQPLVNAFELIRQGHELYRAGGLPRGDSTGFESLDTHLTIQPGQTTGITGVPGSGKSEFVDQMMINLLSQGWEFAIYSPENFPVVIHLTKLVEKVVTKPFGPGPTPRMTEAEYRAAAIWITERAFWMEPVHRTPPELIATALRFRKDGRKLGVILDPWNTLDHKRGGLTETDYVSAVLTRVVRLARDANAHVFLVVHPAKIMRDRDGKRPIPTPYDLAGSAHFYNKLDNIICVHRDQAIGSQDVEIHVQKVRFRHIGRVGRVTLKYDRVIGTYFEFAGPHLRDITTGKQERYADPARSPRAQRCKSTASEQAGNRG